MALTREQGMLIDCLKHGGASDATIGAVMTLIPTNHKVALLATELLKKPRIRESELLMLAIRVGHTA